LTESPQELEERECFSMRDMEEALDVLRGMDPPGVGAADLRDSLLIQLEQRGLKRSLAFRLVKRCWRELAAHKYEEAARLLDVEPEAVAEALEVIRSLTPDPGGAYAPAETLICCLTSLWRRAFRRAGGYPHFRVPAAPVHE
ncbi:MAG: hypothetical protein ACLT38_13670, partial [Akkermansia sp.]